jgi:hypothetical protein
MTVAAIISRLTFGERRHERCERTRPGRLLRHLRDLPERDAVRAEGNGWLSDGA